MSTFEHRMWEFSGSEDAHSKPKMLNMLMFHTRAPSSTFDETGAAKISENVGAARPEGVQEPRESETKIGGPPWVENGNLQV